MWIRKAKSSKNYIRPSKNNCLVVQTMFNTTKAGSPTTTLFKSLLACDAARPGRGNLCEFPINKIQKSR